MQALWAGLAALGDPRAIVLLLAGMLSGTLVGAVPGLGGAVLMSVLLPFLYQMPVVPALALMVAAHASIYFSGSTTAILFNAPGAPESAATTMDGYAMARKGQAARALGISAAATTLGGWLGFVGFIAAVPLMLFFVTLVHPPEFFLLAVLAIVLIGQLRSASVTKGILSGVLGFMVAFVGYDPIDGVQRFTFGQLSLYDGVSIPVVALGLFAVSEMIYLYGTDRPIVADTSLEFGAKGWSEVMRGVRDVFGHLGLVVRSAAIGIVSGLVPGVGGLAANFLSYGLAMKTSRHGQLFGTGVPEGVIAPEASSLSKEAGSLIPTVALGIPGTVHTAILLSAFTILGLTPGPKMLTTDLPLVFTMAWVLAISSLLASLIGLGLAPHFARLTRLPGPILAPFVIALAFVGAYASTTDLFQVVMLVAFGVVGLVMKRLGYSPPAAIMGFVLGGIAERNLHLTVQIFGWSFVQRPLSDVLLVLIAGLIVARLAPRARLPRLGLGVRPERAEGPIR